MQILDGIPWKEMGWSVCISLKMKQTFCSHRCETHVVSYSKNNTTTQADTSLNVWFFLTVVRHTYSTAAVIFLIPLQGYFAAFISRLLTYSCSSWILIATTARAKQALEHWSFKGILFLAAATRAIPQRKKEESRLYFLSCYCCCCSTSHWKKNAWATFLLVILYVVGLSVLQAVKPTSERTFQVFPTQFQPFWENESVVDHSGWKLP